MTFKMKGSGFYGKGNQSPAKQKDYLDAKQQQQQVASGRVDLEEKKEKAAIRKSERSHKYRSRIVGGPGAAII